MIFELLARQIQATLNESGGSYLIKSEMDTQQAKLGEYLEQFDNVGVLYVNYGTLNILPNDKGATGTVMLDLFMRVKDGATTITPITTPLYALQNKSNGIIQGDSTYSYVMNFHFPASDGVLYSFDTLDKFVKYTMTIDVTVTKDLLLGNIFRIQIWHDGQWTELDGLISTVLTPNVQLNTVGKINALKYASKATLQKWGMQVTCLLMGNALHNEIYENCDNLDKVWQVRYSKDGATFKEKSCVMSDTAFSFEKGVFSRMAFVLTEADDG